MDLLEDLLSYAREHIPGVRFAIQTNGCLLDDRAFALLRAYDVETGVSLDAPARLHDAVSGQPTFQGVLENLERAAQRDPDYVVDLGQGRSCPR